MKKEIDNIFVDVRNAFRLLNRYQKRMLQIVTYIREQTPYTDMWGARDWYFDEIGKRRDSPDTEYAKLRVYKDMWGWDFLYGYLFEYYFGTTKIGKKKAEMSIFQISDDGYFISDEAKKHMTDISSFEPSEFSHSYLMFNTAIYTTQNCKHWLWDPAFPNDNGKDFLTKFLSSTSDTKIIKHVDGEVEILKKYEMQKFATQQDADMVIRNYGKIINEQTGMELFKSNFYD
jgi:hypothetical protein